MVWQCDECSHTFFSPEWASPACPSCGAHMSTEDDEPELNDMTDTSDTPDDKVVYFANKRPVQAPGEPVPDVVEAFEDMLERAKKGEITAVAMAYTVMNGATGSRWAGGHGTRHELATAIMVLNYRYPRALLGIPGEED